MKVNQNTLRLVRALVKLTSAVTDIDNITEEKSFKFKVKHILLTWQKWIEDYTNDSMVKLTKADDVTLLSLIKIYDEFDKKVVTDDRFKAGINLILAKTNSALRDLEGMTGEYVEHTALLNEKLVHLITTDVLQHQIEETVIKELIIQMNEISDKMIIGTL
jgi:hypothetical protein